jgi:pimeloyl-ACP methyl ester carboxylesterase
MLSAGKGAKMKKRILTTALAVALMFILVIPVACPRPAQFELSDLVISPAEVISGEEVTVTTKVSNTGGVVGTYTATLKIDGVEVETKEVTIEAGDTTTLVFTLVEDTPESYHIELDGLSGTLEVFKWPVKFEPAPVLFEVPFGKTVECGYLTIPEDHSQLGGPTIRLYVAIFKSQSINPAPDPVVYLAGGPGSKAIESVSLTFNERFAPFLVGRDLIVFDQRGTGCSEPALDCPEVVELAYEVLPLDLTPEESTALSTEAICSCRDRLVSEGVNLTAYSSAESAADLNDLRLALGYEEWNLYGLSYGTKLALTAMRDYPEGIRSVILDSTYPLQVNSYVEVPANFDRALSVFFDSCANDPACSKAYPDLEAVFWELVGQLNASPVTFPVTQPLSGETYDVLMDGDSLIGFIHGSLYATEIIPFLPKVIYDARDGSYDIIALLLGSFLADTEFISHGMHYSVQYSEELSFSTPEELAAACDDYPALQDYYYELCNTDQGVYAIAQVWGAGGADTIENEPVTSDIPTLILAGEYDPVTPPAWGQMVAADLANSYYLEFPGVGHGVALSGEWCPMDVALAFLDDPTALPDHLYVASMSGPVFFTPETELNLVPFTSATFGISGIVPEGWEEVSPGVYARSPLGLVVVLQQAAPYVGAENLLQLVTESLGLEEVPEKVGNRKSDNFSWSLYEFEVQGVLVDMAVAESRGTSYLILLQSPASERDFYHAEVYLPVVDALKSTR